MRTDYTGGRELKTWTLLRRDIFFYLFVSFIVETWVIFFMISALAVDDPATSEDESLTADVERILLVAFWAVTTGFLGVITWRYRLWSTLVKGGVEVHGKVRSMKTTAQYGMFLVTVSYRFEGEDIVTSKPIGGLLPKFRKTIREGQDVSLLVNRNKPGRYIILDLILEPMP
jgi:hypothetical protein